MKWETSVNEQGQWDVCEEGGGDMVADLSMHSMEEGQRFGRLIAAAPELLEQLKLAEQWLTTILYNGPIAGLKDVVDYMPNNWRGVIDMREAIAKAEGQS